MMQALDLTLDLPEVTVTAVHAASPADEAGYLPSVLNQLKQLGFTMQGGVYVELCMGPATDPVLQDYVRVARRLSPKHGQARSTLQARQPEYMSYFAIRNEYNGANNWGAEMINALIAANGGELPQPWLTASRSGAAQDGMPLPLSR